MNTRISKFFFLIPRCTRWELLRQSRKSQLLRKPKAHYCFYRSLSLEGTLNRTHPRHILTHYVYKFPPLLSSHLCLGLECFLRLTAMQCISLWKYYMPCHTVFIVPIMTHLLNKFPLSIFGDIVPLCIYYLSTFSCQHLHYMSRSINSELQTLIDLLFCGRWTSSHCRIGVWQTISTNRTKIRWLTTSTWSQHRISPTPLKIRDLEHANGAEPGSQTWTPNATYSMSLS